MSYVIKPKHNWNKLEKKLNNVSSRNDVRARNKLILIPIVRYIGHTLLNFEVHIVSFLIKMFCLYKSKFTIRNLTIPYL